jgi:hypothetical protein
MSAKSEKASKESEEKVQMEKDGELVVLEYDAVESKKGEGFQVVGTTDADGNETAKVVGTPAHVFLTSDGYLKAIPDNYDLLVKPTV